VVQSTKSAPTTRYLNQAYQTFFEEVVLPAKHVLMCQLYGMLA
jgi:hypothetical protein